MALLEADPGAGVDVDAVRTRLRQRAATKRTRASRIATLRLAGVSHERARIRMGLRVEDYRRARKWLAGAVTEALMATDELLTVDEALLRFSERHVEGVLKLGLMREQGRTQAQIMERLGIGRDEFEVASSWWRDALVGSRGA